MKEEGIYICTLSTNLIVIYTIYKIIYCISSCISYVAVSRINPVLIPGIFSIMNEDETPPPALLHIEFVCACDIVSWPNKIDM